jgi:hypothetical protein
MKVSRHWLTITCNGTTPNDLTRHPSAIKRMWEPSSSTVETVSRVYVEDRNITDAPGSSLMWKYEIYQLELGTAILKETNNPHSINGSMMATKELSGMDTSAGRSSLDMHRLIAQGQVRHRTFRYHSGNA